MIIFDNKTARFRDADTGRLRSDLSGLLSSNARRQYREFSGNNDVALYRSNIGKKFHTDTPRKVSKPFTVVRSNKKGKVFESAKTKKFDDYINGWLADFNFIADEDETDLDTP